MYINEKKIIVNFCSREAGSDETGILFRLIILVHPSLVGGSEGK